MNVAELPELPENDKWLTSNEAAEFMGLKGTSGLITMEGQYEFPLPVTRIKGRKFYKESDLRRYLIDHDRKVVFARKRAQRLADRLT